MRSFDDDEMSIKTGASGTPQNMKSRKRSYAAVIEQHLEETAQLLRADAQQEESEEDAFGRSIAKVCGFVRVRNGNMPFQALKNLSGPFKRKAQRGILQVLEDTEFQSMSVQPSSYGVLEPIENSSYCNNYGYS